MRIETALMAVLRVCERFGLRPGDVDRMSPGLVRVLIEYDLVRRQEEQRG